MYNCVAIFDSGNFAFTVCRILEKKGYCFEVISTPCQIARGGCGYCLKFPEDYRSMVIDESIKAGYPVREMFMIVPMFSRNKYERLELE